jgi:phage-related minor tail protein
MKSITSLLLVVPLAALLAGCASAGYQSGQKTSNNIQKAADKIAALSAQVDTTLTTLNDLVTKPAPDLRPQFKSFQSSLKSLENHAADITKARMAMADEGKQFLAKWDEQIAQINNEDIKSRSVARRAEVTEKLQAIKRSYAETEVAFTPFLSELRDVQKFLNVDLTTGGLAAISASVTKAKTNAGPLKQALGKLAADFKAVGVAMSSVTPAPAPAK